jgi:hypothetical protein
MLEREEQCAKDNLNDFYSNGGNHWLDRGAEESMHQDWEGDKGNVLQGGYLR